MKNKLITLICVNSILLLSCTNSTESTFTDTENNNNDVISLDNTQDDITQTKPFDALSLKEITTIPKEIVFKGELMSAYEWEDANGLNVLVNSEKKWEEENNEGYTVLSGSLYSLHYIKTNDGYKELVETVDRLEWCDLDLTLEFKSNPVIQDSNNNGVAEVIIAYIKTCRGDVSPANLKVLMHEGEKKYGLRGQEYLAFTKDFFIPEGFEYNLEVFKKSGVELEDGFIEDGRYVNENDFENAPMQFLSACKKVWIENVEYKMY